MMKKCLFLFLFISRGLSAQNIIYVNANILGGQQDGSSWTNAMPDLQLALDLVTSGDQIWVAKGTYFPTVTTDRSISFYLKQGVRMFGGFSGNETNLQDRDIDLNETILSGNIGDENLANDNSLHVLRGAGLDSNTLVDGFTVTQGYAYNSLVTEWDVRGGGLLLQASPFLPNTCPIIQNCRFINNYAGSGAAIHAQWDFNTLVNPIIRNCMFVSNRAFVLAGALYKGSPTPFDQPFIVKNCIFLKNRALGGDGGAVFLTQLSNKASFINCRFEKDSTPLNGGGIQCLGYAEPGGSFNLTLDSCLFIENYANEGVGLNFLDYSYAELLFECTIKNTQFLRNRAKGGAGAAYFIVTFDNGKINLSTNNVRIVSSRQSSYGVVRIEGDHVDASFSNCSILDTKNPLFADGGTIHGLYMYFKEGKIDISNCTFAHNGAGVYIGSPEEARVVSNLANCTFFDNGEYVVDKNWYPNYYYTDSIYNNCYINNCVFWESGASAIFWNSALDVKYYDYHIDYSALSVISDNIYAPGGMEAFGEHNIFRYDWDQYPMFVDTLNDDFHLLPCSPLVNAGDNLVVDTLGLSTDLDGNPRIFRDTVDMGAYETQDSCLSSPSTEPHLPAPSLTLSPNPSGPGDEVLVQTNTAFRNGEIPWQLLNLQGQTLKTGQFTRNGTSRFLIEAPVEAGLYLVVIEGFLPLKLVVQK